jgi:hypothetical protein
VAIDAKTYQDVSPLSRSPDPIHQPLLHTFDGGKAASTNRPTDLSARRSIHEA